VAKRVIVAVIAAPEKASRTPFLASANFSHSFTFWKIARSLVETSSIINFYVYKTKGVHDIIINIDIITSRHFFITMEKINFTKLIKFTHRRS
jgi:hypothetical protein